MENDRIFNCEGLWNKIKTLKYFITIKIYQSLFILLLIASSLSSISFLWQFYLKFIFWLRLWYAILCSIQWQPFLFLRINSYKTNKQLALDWRSIVPCCIYFVTSIHIKHMWQHLIVGKNLQYWTHWSYSPVA